MHVQSVVVFAQKHHQRDQQPGFLVALSDARQKLYLW